MDKKSDDTVSIKPEDLYNPTDSELRAIGSLYERYYTFDNVRSNRFKQFQNKTLEEYLTISRTLFWTSAVTSSDDLSNLGLDFSFPFVRKEVLDFVGRISSLNISPKITGEDLTIFGAKVLHAMFRKWRLKSNDRVEKFYQTLYGVVNGTVCLYVYWDGKQSTKRFLTEYDAAVGEANFTTETYKDWNDVRVEIVPIEEMYLQKVWQRKIQEQGRTIRKQHMALGEFKDAFPEKLYPNARFVLPGSLISGESLYHELLGGSGILATSSVEVLTEFDTENDTKLVSAQGIALNMLGTGKKRELSPNPFAHKMQPYVWSVFEPIDEKFAYGLSMPFKIKDPHKLLNTSYTMLMEQELRAIDPPILTSDIEAPELIHGQKKVIPVMDVNAYKIMDVKEGSNAFYTMMNSLQGVMSSHAQGGSQQIAPSRQPRAAREIIAMENLKQQALGNTLVLYYDMVQQEIFLFLKTALQFYKSENYKRHNKDLIRAITVPDFPLVRGGIGQLEVRIVKKTQDALKLHFEATQKSIANGKTTEIIEVPVEALNNLDFYISDIKLEQEQTSELERAAWNEQVMAPLLNAWIPMGLADPAKAFLRWAEKNGEHISDFVSDQNLPSMMSAWGKEFQLNPQMKEYLMNRGTIGNTQGNILQSTTGTQYGSQSNGGIQE